MVRGFVLGVAAFGLLTGAWAQVAAPPAGAAAPAAAGAGATPMDAALEPVRQAIARQDYDGARQALEAARQVDPSSPLLVTYDSLLRSRQTSGPVPAGGGIRTPRPGAAPLPVVITPTPAPTPTPVPAPVDSGGADGAGGDVAAADGAAGGAFDDPKVKYGALGTGLLLLVGLVWWVLRRRKAGSTADLPPAEAASAAAVFGGGGFEGSSSTGSYDNQMSGGYGISGGGGVGDREDLSLGGGLSAGSSMSEGSMSGGLNDYSPSFAGLHDDEEERPKPQMRQAPAPEEDDEPVMLFGSGGGAGVTEPETTESLHSVRPDEPPTDGNLSRPADASVESMGINFGGVAEPEPALGEGTSAGARAASGGLADADDITVFVPPPAAVPSAPVNATPTRTPSVAPVSPGDVDIEDLLRSMSVEQDKAEEPVAASSTGSIAASGIAAEPVKDDRSVEDLLAETLSFGGASETTAAPAPVEPEKPAEDSIFSTDWLKLGDSGDDAKAAAETPKAEEPKAATGSLDDALAETLALSFGPAPVEDAPVAESAVAEEPVVSSESLDERSERMFREQLDKARKAMEDKNWRQAVHYLSIASALHPEHEEAKTMLRTARAEKRKAEESV